MIQVFYITQAEIKKLILARSDSGEYIGRMGSVNFIPAGAWGAEDPLRQDSEVEITFNNDNNEV